jgi:hypothetical protein
VILLSDGGANVGETDADLIGSHAEDADGAGIYMVGVGIGGGGTTTASWTSVTDLGKGASLFVPSKAEAQKMLADRFVSTVGVAARDVQVELDLPAELTWCSSRERRRAPTRKRWSPSTSHRTTRWCSTTSSRPARRRPCPTIS